MINSIIKYGVVFYFSVIGLFLSNLYAQEIIQIEPIFEYPVAPEELESLTDKSDYLVKCFWDQLDVKNSQPVNQIALNDAFKVYLTPLRYANAKNAFDSVDKLISRISGNPTLMVQFAKAAEENLYGPRAELWADDIYLKFLDAAAKNKKISKTRREKYSKRADLIRSSNVGSNAPTFDFVSSENKQESYYPMSTPTILIIGDPEDTDWRLARLKLESDTNFTQALEKGKLNVLYLTLSDNKDWANAVSNYSKRWKIGKSDYIREIYDIRTIPSIYLIGSDGKIILKNASLFQTVSKALEIVGS